jgi:hypothetical protein
MRARYRDAIREALAEWCRQAPRWGKDDCALAIANIDMAVIGIDTAAGWRGRYRSASGAVRVMGKGGALGLARRVARKWKWRRLRDLGRARDGDRGVARVGTGLVCVLRYGRFWVGRHHDIGNVLAVDADVIAAWSPL